MESGVALLYHGDGGGGGDGGGVPCVSVNGTKKLHNTKLLMRGGITHLHPPHPCTLPTVDLQLALHNVI